MGKPFEDWEVRFHPYAWFPAIKGNVQLQDMNIAVDFSFKDLVQRIDNAYGVLAYLEFRKNRGGLFLNTTFADLDIRESLYDGYLNLFIDYKQAAFDFGWMLVLYEQEFDYPYLKDIGVDFYATGRFSKIFSQTEIKMSSSAASIIKLDEEWYEPLIGTAIHITLNDYIRYFARGDVAGFRLDAECSWQIASAFEISYPFRGCQLGMTFGYKVVAQRYNNRNQIDTLFKFDTKIHGPIMGLRLIF